MTDKEKHAGKILPEDKKHLKDEMPDHLKSPLSGIQKKSEVGKEAGPDEE